MKKAFTALIQRDGRWWIGWIKELPGVNSQGSSRKLLVSHLRSALREALALYRKEAIASMPGPYEEEIIEV